MRSSSIRLLVGALLSVSSLYSMTPPDRDMIEQYRRDGSLQKRIEFAKSLGNHKVNPNLLLRAQYKLKKAAMAQGLIPKEILREPPPAWKDMPTTGNVKVLTILIDFNDYPHVESLNSLAQMNARIFGTGDDKVPPPYESFREYYLRSSYGKLDLNGNVLGWFRPGYDRKDMQETVIGREKLIKEALTHFENQGHDFSQYDNNGDGRVDFFSVIWSGPHGPWSSFWWGYQTSFNDSAFKLDGVNFGQYSWQWESRVRVPGQPDAWDGPFSPKTLIHEQGHGLGLPDYYDYDDAVGPRGGVGGLDMMDSSGDHNCFSKWLLDWITPSVVNTDLGAASKELRDQSSNEDALIVMPGASAASAFSEFFMVQNRQLKGNDINRPIPGEGLLVWHVDSRLDANNYNYVFNNSFTEHKLLRLMEADGLEQIETKAARADAGDFYISGREIGPTTTPNTSRYDGTWANFGIRNISASAPAMTLDVYTVPADTTAPEGLPTKPSGVAILDEITFTWTQGTAQDPDGQIVGYYLQVGTTPGGSDIYSARVGNVLSKTVRDLGLCDGLPLYAQVRAMNTAGLTSAWSEISDGVVINLPVFAGCADLDNCDLTFKTIGTWEKDAEYYKQGTTSIHGLAKDNERTTIGTRVVGPGTLSFWWKSSSEKDYDYYTFAIDGVAQDRIHGEVDWTERTIEIPAGSHILSWRWAKDGNTTGILDKVWLDGVRYERYAPLVFTQQPANLTVDVNAPVTFSAAVSGGKAPYTYQWYRDGSPVNGANAATYAFTATVADDGRSFKVVVTDSLASPSSITSQDAILTVNGGMREYVESEPNNILAQANGIPKPGFMTARINDKKDTDLFKVFLKRGQTLNARLTCALSPKEGRLKLECLDEQGKVIEKETDNSRILSVKARRDQTLYVRVSAGRRDLTGDYKLELVF